MNLMGSLDLMQNRSIALAGEDGLPSPTGSLHLEHADSHTGRCGLYVEVQLHPTPCPEVQVMNRAGIATIPSLHATDETVDRVKDILQAKGITLFALIDHSGEAEKAGMEMPPTKLLIFGSPKAGTPLMLASPSIAIDLPLKLLVWEDGQGKTWISYNDPEYLRERHGLPQDLMAVLHGVEALAAQAAK